MDFYYHPITGLQWTATGVYEVDLDCIPDGMALKTFIHILGNLGMDIYNKLPLRHSSENAKAGIPIKYIGSITSNT